MVSKVNLKARIDRHSRVLKDNLWNIHPFRSFYHKINYYLVLFFILFLFPIYPLFSSFLYDNNSYDFYRWNIDEWTILDSYVEEDQNIDASVMNKDSFLSVNSLLEWERDTDWYDEIIEYVVQKWDSFSSIALKFWISNNSIYWANNFDSKKELLAWEKIKIPPVNWLIHKVIKWENTKIISEKYKVDESKIITQNWLEKWKNLQVWEVLIIPWAIKEEEIKQIAKATPPKKQTTKNNKNNWYYWFTSSWKSEFVKTNWQYVLEKRKPKWSFAWWNCTRFVAQYKNVNWSWNAKQWLANAKAKWHATWKEASIWSIVVFNWIWYNPRYWHVWIVIDVKEEHIIVKDMNYRRLNEVTVRKVPKNDRAIRWYIYVD